MTSIYTTGTQAGAFFNGDTIASIIDVRNVGTAGVTIEDLKVDGELVTTQPARATRFSGITYGETGGLIDTVTRQCLAAKPGHYSYGSRTPASQRTRSESMPTYPARAHSRSGSSGARHRSPPRCWQAPTPSTILHQAPT